MNCFNKTCLNSSISSEILHLATNCHTAHTKIMHNTDLSPFAYAIGFGSKTNASVIVGGVDDDELSSRLLLCFAKALTCATSANSCMLGIDINQVFKRKGIWIVPKYDDITTAGADMDLILQKLNPRQLIEISPFGETVSYFSPKSTMTNTRLFAYLLAVSCDYYIDDSKDNDTTLCNWFASEVGRPAYSIKIGNEQYPSSDSFHQIYNKILESLLLFTTY